MSQTFTGTTELVLEVAQTQARLAADTGRTAAQAAKDVTLRVGRKMKNVLDEAMTVPTDRFAEPVAFAQVSHAFMQAMGSGTTQSQVPTDSHDAGWNQLEARFTALTQQPVCTAFAQQDECFSTLEREFEQLSQETLVDPKQVAVLDEELRQLSERSFARLAHAFRDAIMMHVKEACQETGFQIRDVEESDGLKSALVANNDQGQSLAIVVSADNITLDVAGFGQCQPIIDRFVEALAKRHVHIRKQKQRWHGQPQGGPLFQQGNRAQDVLRACPTETGPALSHPQKVQAESLHVTPDDGMVSQRRQTAIYIPQKRRQRK